MSKFKWKQGQYYRLFSFCLKFHYDSEEHHYIHGLYSFLVYSSREILCNYKQIIYRSTAYLYAFYYTRYTIS